MEGENKKKKRLFLLIFIIIIILIAILLMVFNPFKKNAADSKGKNSSETKEEIKEPEEKPVEEDPEEPVEEEPEIIQPESISLDTTDITLFVNETKTIVATVSPEDAVDQSVIWSSSDDSIVSVIDGKITGLKEGTVTITVKTQNDKVATAKVKVIPKDAEIVKVTSISLKAPATTINVGNTISIDAKVIPEDATDKTITWSSSDTKIAVVSGGDVTGIGPGKVVITAKSSNGKKASVTIIVNPIQVSSVILNRKDATIKVGETISLVATIIPNNATDKTIIWSSSDASVATVSDKGIVKGLKAGTATITVTTKNGKADNCAVTVQIIPATGVTLNSTSKTLNVNETFQLTATVTPSNATNKDVTWSSSDTSVATVTNKGLVKAIKDGTATITATTDNGKKATFTVTVKTPVTGVSLNYATVYMLPENSKEDEGTYKRALTATVSPSNATNKEVTWSSSNPAVATVDSNGVILAKKAGKTTITVKTKDGSKIATATVNVESNELTNIYEISPSLVCALTRNTSNNVRAMQGVYFYKSGSTVYSLYAGYEADDKPTVMTLVNLNTCSVITKNNEQVFGHANDISYADGKFYVVNSNKVHGLTVTNNNTITLDANPIKMNYSFSGFEYDSVNKRFYSKAGNYMYTFPKLTSPKTSRTWIGIVPSYYSNIDGGEIKIVNQGLAYANGNIYIPRTISDTNSTHYNHSYIHVYDANTAKYKYTLHFSGDFLCHLEGMTVIGDSMYLGMNCHQASPKNQTFLVYTGLAAMEQRYQNS